LKRILLTLLSLAWLTLPAACSRPTATPSSPLTSPPAGATGTSAPLENIRIAVDATFPPFEMTTSRNEFRGFDIELMQAAAARAGYNVTFINLPKNQVLDGVLACQYDGGISAIALTDDLRRQIQFSDPYLEVGQVIVVKTGNVKITGRDSLAGMTVAAQRGAPLAAELQNLPGVDLIMYPSIDGAFSQLISGYIDAVIATRPLAQSYAYVPANRLKITAGEFGSESYGIALCRERSELVKRINAGLAAAKADGTVDRLAEKWFKNNGR
jgi:polar amino acid transport system substrate-binding protein